jgi:hypothetical protein
VSLSVPSKVIEVPPDALRAMGAWAGACAARALVVCEHHTPNDPRARAAIEAILGFAAGEPRSARLRRLAWAAGAAARAARTPAAAAAARAAGLAASIAYTHALASAHQTRHVLGPAAYAALALELEAQGDRQVGDREARHAIECAPWQAIATLQQMPPLPPARSRLAALFAELDQGLRQRSQGSTGVLSCAHLPHPSRRASR